MLKLYPTKAQVEMESELLTKQLLYKSMQFSHWQLKQNSVSRLAFYGSLLIYEFE